MKSAGDKRERRSEPTRKAMRTDATSVGKENRAARAELTTLAEEDGIDVVRVNELIAFGTAFSFS